MGLGGAEKLRGGNVTSCELSLRCALTALRSG
jgi:hypothetical protein